jgi:hypothetical protein
LKDLFVRIFRNKLSYQYKRFPNRPDDWNNNDNNNTLDNFTLYYDEGRIFQAKVQTVANIPGGRYFDTIAPGPFQIKCFVDPRLFYGRIHGICNAYDLDGQLINENSIETVVGDNGAPISLDRWLIHDTQSKKPKPPMTLTRVAWSAGCFIMSPSNLKAFNDILDAYKVLSNEIINGELLDE